LSDILQPASSTSTPKPRPNDAPNPTTAGAAAAPKGRAGFKLNVHDALTPDQTNEDMFATTDNKFAFSPGQLSKLLNPKSLDALYALGGLAGLEKGLRTNRDTGLSVDETTIDGAVTFEEVAPKGTPKYGANGDTLPVLKEESAASAASGPAPTHNAGSEFADRKRIFRDNRLPEKKSKSLLQLAWISKYSSECSFVVFLCWKPRDSMPLEAEVFGLTCSRSFKEL
jgi:Ca2+-transporting ATPase